MNNDNDDFNLWSVVVDGFYNLLFLLGVFATGAFVLLYFWSKP